LPVHLLIFTNKIYRQDFRKYLMRAVEQSGGRALHLCLLDRLILSWGGDERAGYPANCNSDKLGQTIRDHLTPGPVLGLTGLGGTILDEPGPMIAAKLHKDFCDVHWVYDVYDDVLFNAEGSERVRRLLADAAWRCRCEHSILLDPELQTRYVTAYHLDNASHLQLLPSVATTDPRKTVYIGSIDRRVDFTWLDALAANDVTIDIFGSIHISAPEMRQELNELTQRRRNVSFHGPYDNDDLPTILAQFRVGLLPYHVGHPMTDHVNPDKLHHYLSAGLAVVASPIPAARRLQRFLHVIATNGDWAGVLSGLRTTRLEESWPRESYTWDRRWAELVNLVLPDEVLRRESIVKAGIKGTDRNNIDNDQNNIVKRARRRRIRSLKSRWCSFQDLERT
jgi:Glycosyl transferases group 1